MKKGKEVMKYVVRIFVGDVRDENTLKRRRRSGYVLAKKLEKEVKEQIYLEELDKIPPAQAIKGVDYIIEDD